MQVMETIYAGCTIVRAIIEVVKVCKSLYSVPEIRALLDRAWKAVTTLLHRIQEAFTIKRLVPVESKIEKPRKRRRP